MKERMEKLKKRLAAQPANSKELQQELEEVEQKLKRTVSLTSAAGYSRMRERLA